ncbi:MAG: ABC transporter permease [Lachnospiraceae bacterium]|nr:ABC transporter permease [Lachnospiraceae bacterium]
MIDQIFALAISDFKGRFSGSYLGVFWGVIQPLSNILLFWFVFQVGFRSNPIDNVPFILWLAAGMIPWNYFYDSWFDGTNTFVSYSYIVKKVVFNIEVLPLVKVLSSSILNLIFNGILIIIYCIYNRFMGFHIFDMIYYSFCLFMLTLGLSYITATLNVFIKDIGQFMGIILQILMWLTPMMWSYEMIPTNLQWIYKFNPLHYVINGYRESLINGYWFFHQKEQMVWFWIVTIIIFLTGKSLMNKLKDHFADVL